MGAAGTQKSRGLVELGDERRALPRVRAAVLLGRRELGDELGVPAHPDDRQQLVGLGPAQRVQRAGPPQK